MNETEQRYKVGERVELIPFPDEDERDTERGTIIEVDLENQSVTVSVDFAHRKVDDDGLRTIVYDDWVATGNTQDRDENAVIMRKL